MKKIMEELLVYPNTLTDFRNHIRVLHNVRPDAFDAATNAVVIPHLIAFIETYTDLSFLDALIYAEINLKGERLKHNDLVKKAIKVIFYKLEHKQEIDLVPF